MCSDNRANIKCSGKGITKKYLILKLSEAGLLGEKERITSDDAVNTIHFLNRLTNGQRRKLYTEYGADTVGELSRLLTDIPADEMAYECRSFAFLCTNAFFGALFHDVYPDLYDVFASVDVTMKMEEFLDTYSARREASGFWELLYNDMDEITPFRRIRDMLEGVINEEVEQDPEPLLLYPVTSLFLGQRYGSFRDVIAESGDNVGRYLD